MLNKSNNRRLQIHKSDGKIKSNRKSKRTVNSRGRIQIYGAAATQVARDLNSIRRFINTEIHYTDAVGNGVASTSTAAFVLLNGLTLGDTMTTRTGQSLKCDGIDLRFAINGNSAAIPLYQRVMVVLDKQPNSAIFAIGDLLNATTATSMYTVGNQMRFVVMFDESYTMVPASDSFSIIKSNKINANQHVMYNTGNAGTVADIITNSIYLIHFSDQAVNNSSFTYYSRLWFIDN